MYICIFINLCVCVCVCVCVCETSNVQNVATFNVCRFCVIGAKIIKLAQNCEYVIPLCISISKKKKNVDHVLTQFYRRQTLKDIQPVQCHFVLGDYEPYCKRISRRTYNPSHIIMSICKTKGNKYTYVYPF